MLRAARRAAERLGRRGAYLAIAGAGWLLYGTGIVLDPREGTVRAAAVLRHVAPLEVWGWAWVLCAAIALGTAWSRCPERQAVGYAAATAPPLLWASGYAAAWALGEHPQAWAGAATWAAAALQMMIVAGWREHRVVPRE